MKWLAFTLVCLANIFAADPKTGLLARASDGELTVYFVAPTPNVVIVDEDSVHPQLKPAFKVEWSGFLAIPKTGDYVIHGPLSLRIDGRQVAGQKVKLPAGERNLRVEIVRKKGEPIRIKLEWESDDLPRQTIPAAVFSHEREPDELRENQARDLGRELFENFSCVVCHGEPPTPYATGVPLTNAVKALPLRSLQPTQGCLSETPEGQAVNFKLTESQREALQLFVQTPDISPASAIDLARQMRRLNCAQCHEWNGPAQTQPERAAPSLTEKKMTAVQWEAALRMHLEPQTIFKNWPAEEAIPAITKTLGKVQGE